MQHAWLASRRFLHVPPRHFLSSMAVNLGEPGNRYEVYARKQLSTLTFEFDDSHNPRPCERCSGLAHVLHPSDIGPELHKVIFTNCPSEEVDLKELSKEWQLAIAYGSLENSDRSTIVGVDAVIIPKWCNLSALDAVRSSLYLAEIKLKVDGVVDAATMGATAHRAWAMEAAGRRRNWMVVTDDDHLATMLKNPKSKGLTDEDDSFYTTVVIPPPAELLELRKTIGAATIDMNTLAALVNDLKNQASADLQLSLPAQRIVDLFDDFESRKAKAAAACEESKEWRHLRSARHSKKKRKRASE